MILSVFNKSLKEQIRNFWILILTLSLAPFFVFVYYLINEAEDIRFDVLVHVMEPGDPPSEVVRGFFEYADAYLESTPEAPLTIRSSKDRLSAMDALRAGSADVLVILPEDFTQLVLRPDQGIPRLEIIGDLTSTSYLVGAVWMGELVNAYLSEVTGKEALYHIKETALDDTGSISEFERWMPGMLILSVIMLMFSATIAIITEVDQGTILRLKLSQLKAWQYLLGVGGVQVLVGITSLALTYLAASLLGFENRGCFLAFSLITFLAILSMIAFSLLLAGLTRSVTEVLVVGNFPLFLFMFFSGAAFPITATPWFHLGGYGVSWQSLLSPSPAIQALTKVSILGLGLTDVLPELGALIVLTAFYFLIGLWVFQRRHLSMT